VKTKTKFSYRQCLQQSLRIFLALLLVLPAAFPHTAEAAPANKVLTPVSSSLSWISSSIAVSGDSISFDAGSHFPQLTSLPVEVSAASDRTSVASAAADNGRIDIRVNSAGSARVAIVGEDGFGFRLTDYIGLNVTLLGDTNGDGAVTSVDVLYIYKVVNGQVTPSEEEKNRLDVNRDGQITSADATILMSTYVGKTPATGGVAFLVSLQDSNDAPVADQGSISGTVQSEMTLTGTYRYADPENDAEGTSMYQWYRGSQADGSDKAPVSGANGITYAVQDADVGQYLFFQVTPVDSKGKAGEPSSAATSGTVPDTAPPLLSFTEPAHLAANASRNGGLRAEFNEPVAAVDGKWLHIRNAATDAIVASYSVKDETKVTISGVTVAIVNPGFDDGASYYIEIEPGAFQDAAGNAFAGFAGSSVWRFATADTIGPIVSSLSPSNGAAGVDKYTVLKAVFNEPVQAGSGKKLEIRRVSDNGTVASYSTDDPSKILISGNELLVANPGLEEAIGYYLFIEDGAVEDISGNAFAGFGSSDWVFVTADTTAPTVSVTTPSDGAIGVALDASLTVSFSEPIVAVPGHSIKLRRASDNSEAFSYDAADTTKVTIAGNTIELLNPGLASETSYYVEMEPGAFQDAAGNAFSGMAGSGAWSFTTLDATAPTTVGFSPAHQSTVASNDEELKITFNEPVVAVDGKTVTIHNVTDDADFAAFILGTDMEVSVNGSVVTIEHAAFESLKDYTVVIESGAFEDQAGNPFAGLSAGVWEFASFDTRALTVVPDSPLSEGNLEGALLNVTLVGDEFADDDLTAHFQLNGAPSGLSIIGAGRMSPTEAFIMLDFDKTDFDADVTDLTITALSSALAKGRPLTSGNLTITAIVEPNVTATIPAANTDNFDKAAPLAIVFDKNVTAVTGKKMTIHKKADGSIVETIIVSDTAKVSIDGSTVTVQHTTFAEGTEYFVLLEAGAFADVNGFGSEAIVGSSIWDFRTAAAAVPEMFFSEIARGGEYGKFAFELYYSPDAAGPNPASANTYSIWVYQYDVATASIVTKEIKIPLLLFKAAPYIIIDGGFYDFFDITVNIPGVLDLGWIYFDEPNKPLKALVLKKGSEVLDVVGDPNAAGPVPFLASGDNYIRKPGIKGGSSTFDVSQWNVLTSQNVFGDFSRHMP